MRPSPDPRTKGAFVMKGLRPIPVIFETVRALSWESVFPEKGRIAVSLRSSQ